MRLRPNRFRMTFRVCTWIVLNASRVEIFNCLDFFSSLTAKFIHLLVYLFIYLFVLRILPARAAANERWRDREHTQSAVQRYVMQIWREIFVFLIIFFFSRLLRNAHLIYSYIYARRAVIKMKKILVSKMDTISL